MSVPKWNQLLAKHYAGIKQAMRTEPFYYLLKRVGDKHNDKLSWFQQYPIYNYTTLPQLLNEINYGDTVIILYPGIGKYVPIDVGPAANHDHKFKYTTPKRKALACIYEGVNCLKLLAEQKNDLI